MSKAFWQGFREGYMQASYKMLPIVLALIVGWAFGQYFHPYESCKRMYSSPKDIVECVWIKANG
jgi:hypothetical protein